MGRKTIGIVLNGVTGRMGLRQHLLRSVLAIRQDGGLPLRDGTVLWPGLSWPMQASQCRMRASIRHAEAT